MDDLRLECRQLTTLDDNDPLFREWVSFVDGADVRCGFWCDPAVCGMSWRPDDELHLVRVSRAGQRIAVLPFRRYRARLGYYIGLLRLGSTPAWIMRLADAEFPVRVGESRVDIARRALVHLRCAADADILFVENCPLESGTYRAGHGIRVRNAQPTYLIDVPRDHTAYLAGLKARTRQTLRRKTRRLQQACDGGLSMRCFRTPAETVRLHGLLERVWRRSWHGALERQAPPSAGFLEAVAERGWLRSYVLFNGEEPIATALGFQYRGTFLDEAPAYDRAWQAHSPGLCLFHLLLEDLFRADVPNVVDFGFGYNQYKAMLGSRREMRGQLWTAATERGRAALVGQVACDATYRAGKKLTGKLGFVRRFKRRLQGGG